MDSSCNISYGPDIYPAADTQRKDGLQQPGAQEELEAVGHQTLEMNIACSGVGRCKDVQHTEGADACLVEERYQSRC